MRFYRLSACCAALLAISWLRDALALSHHSSDTSSSAQHRHSVSADSAASRHSPGVLSAAVFTALQPQWQRGRGAANEDVLSAQQPAQPAVTEKQVAWVSLVHDDAQRVLRANTHASRLTVSSHSQRSRSSAEESASHEAFRKQQTTDDSTQGHGRHMLRATAQLPVPAGRQRTAAGLGRRVIDSGPALDGGVRLSTAELIAAAADPGPADDIIPGRAGASAATSQGSGFSLGAAEVAPGEDAWWHQVRQDPAQCGIIDAAPSTLLRGLDDYAPEACSQLCRCGTSAETLGNVMRSWLPLC